MPSSRILVCDLTSRTPPYDRALCEALQRRGHALEMWAAGCYTDDFDRMSVPRRRGLVDVAAHVPGLSARATKYAKAIEYVVNLAALAAHLWRTRPDVLHVQWLPLLEVLPQVEMALLRACRQWDIPVVYTVHDVLPLDDEEGHRRTFRRVYHSVDRLICHTKTAQRRLIDEFGVSPSAIFRIPHGPLLESAAARTRDDARATLSLPLNQPIALLFGVLRPYKGVEKLVQAWERVERQVPHARLIIAGGGQESYVDQVRRTIDQADLSTIEARLRFLPEEELSRLIAASDLLVYPYRRITQSGALLSGMNAGKAIVATRVGGLKETLSDGRTGRLVPPDDPDALAQAIADLLLHPDERRRLAHAVKTEVKERYSWEAIAERTIDCYRDAGASV